MARVTHPILLARWQKTNRATEGTVPIKTFPVTRYLCVTMNETITTTLTAVPVLSEVEFAGAPALARPVQTENSVPGNLPIAILGVAFDPVTLPDAIARIEAMIATRRAHYVVTANVDFLVQSRRDAELRRILRDAHLTLCDG